MTTKLIIFDFDGTLGDTRRNIVTTMQMTIKELQLPSRTEAECASTIGLPLAGCFRALFPDIQEGIVSRCAETYRRIFNENLQKIMPEAFPGVVKTLEVLKEQGFELTIASSRSHNSLTELTHNMGIADNISYLIGADDVKEAKPKPEPILKTLAAMQFEASETLVVGDMAVDILMGASAGAKTCGVTWGNGTREELKEAGADFIIDKMEGLLEIVDESNDKRRMKIIDDNLINGVVEQAKQSPRLRMNYNFHQSLDEKCHRFLNCLEPGTFIPVHHHPTKAETFVILKGKVRVSTYNDDGEVLESCVISQESGAYGVDIPKNVWHGLECLEPSVLLECKEGPFVEHDVDGILEVKKD